MGSTLAKMATAVILLDWHRRSPPRSRLPRRSRGSPHAYTGAIYVTVSVFCALRGSTGTRRPRPGAAECVGDRDRVALLQLPYVVHQVSTRFADSAMRAVTAASDVFSPEALCLSSPKCGRLFDRFQHHRNGAVAPPLAGAVLLICGGIVAVRYRRDPVFVIMMLVPQIAAIAGYALFLAPWTLITICR